VRLAVPDTGVSVEVRLDPLPLELTPTVISERQDLLPRVYERQSKHLGYVVFSEDLPQYQAFSVSDLFFRVPRFFALLSRTKSCRRTNIYVDGRSLPPEWDIDEYVKLSEVTAIEVHSSADFIREDFLQYAPDLPTPASPQRLGAINLGTSAPMASQGLSGRCGSVVMVWTKWYRPPRY
jgi:hypothetical protein